MRFKKRKYLFAVFFFMGQPLIAEDVKSTLLHYQNEFKNEFGKQLNPDESKGKLLYFTESEIKKGTSCTTCHTQSPLQSGKTRANKVIDPLSPNVNNKRFTDLKKTEKWFRRNCQDILGRDCTAEEKINFITYVINFK